MTNLADDTDQESPRYKQRKRRGGLFVNDTELIERLGVPEKEAREALRMLDSDARSGFPKKQKLWGGRRYWPAIEAYFERTQGVNLAPPLRRAS